MGDFRCLSLLEREDETMIFAAGDSS